MRITDITPDEISDYQRDYLKLVNNEWTLVEELEVSVHKLVDFIRNIPMDKYDYRYAEGKWTIKDILQHLIDSERIFSYRALCFSRGDKTILPGFDEDFYAANANSSNRHLTSLLNEIVMVRQSSIMLFKSLSDEQLILKGKAFNYTISVRALGFLIIGHQNHHIDVFKARYL